MKLRAEQAGEHALEIHEDLRGKEMELLLRRDSEIAHRSWKGAGGTSVLGAKNIYPFFHEQARQLADLQAMRFVFLKLNTERMAFVYAW